MDSGTILILKQELEDKDLPTLSLNNLNFKIILKEFFFNCFINPTTPTGHYEEETLLEAGLKVDYHVQGKKKRLMTKL